MTPTDAEIIARCRSGELIEDINRSDPDGSDPNSLLSRCVVLHNDGQIDLLALTESAQFGALSASMFFVSQHFFCEAIPRLQTPVEPLMKAVSTLVSKGGADLMASTPNDAFRKWCSVDLRRAESIVTGAESGDVQSIAFLTFALVALNDAQLARSIVAKYSDERRLSALFSLGRIVPKNDEDAEKSLQILLPFIDSAFDELTRCNSLMPALQICEAVPAIGPKYFFSAIAAASTNPTPALLYNLAQALWLHQKQFDRASIERALTALRMTDPTLGKIIGSLDLALKNLLETDDSDLAVDYLTDALATGDRSLDLDQFKSTQHALAGGDRDRLFKLLVRWLLSGDRKLCEAASDMLVTGERAVPFDTSTAGLGLTDDDQVLLAYKALGWLFTNEVTAASILVACVRGSGSDAAKYIGGLLFDPFLINYGGKLRDYLKSIKKGDAAYPHVRAALKSGEAYVKGLDISPEIKELRPSEYQRSVERRHAHDMMRKVRKVRKDAEKQSVFFNLVHRSTLLHGRRSITFVHLPGEKARPVSMDLHTISHSFELPRQEVIDPVGLGLTLLTFRRTRRK